MIGAIRPIGRTQHFLIRPVDAARIAKQAIPDRFARPQFLDFLFQRQFGHGGAPCLIAC